MAVREKELPEQALLDEHAGSIRPLKHVDNAHNGACRAEYPTLDDWARLRAAEAGRQMDGGGGSPCLQRRTMSALTPMRCFAMCFAYTTCADWGARGEARFERYDAVPHPFVDPSRSATRWRRQSGSHARSW